MGAHYLIAAEPRSHSGKRLFLTGQRFSDHGKPVRFQSLSTAQTAARWLARTFPLLKKYRIEIDGVNNFALVGKWRMNPSDPYPFHRSKPAQSDYFSHNAATQKAARLLKNFSGHAPREVLQMKQAPIKTGLVIGTLDAVPYTTVRDGKRERYIHQFSKDARPLLIASSDGRRLGIVGGRFQFTERGIVDDK